MKMNSLGRTGLSVSELCLGTMTFGTQTDEAEAHAQMDRTRDAGINFLDCAEMYPVNPMTAETVGLSEEILGRWFARTGRRDAWVVATKHSGAGSVARDGEPISADSIPRCIEASLKRLQTDVIDLYQFHWPNRGSYMFRKNWSFDPSGQDRAETVRHMHDCLGALQREVDRGTIRILGKQLPIKWRVNPTRCHGVTADAIRAVLERGVVTEGRHGGFGGGVHAVQRIGAKALDRTDVDDGRMQRALCAHQGQGVLGG